MSERIYLLLVGIYILTALYLEQNIMIYALLGFMFLEGITDVRLTRLLQKARNVELDDGFFKVQTTEKYNVEATRLLRIVVSIVLATTYILLHEYDYDILWFVPWFMGFAVTGAGVSGICPLVIGIRSLGFK